MTEAPSSQPVPTARRLALGLSLDDWKAWLQEQGEPAFRAGQILGWIHRMGVRDFSEMTNLGSPLRARLDEAFLLRSNHIAQVQGSGDTTRKFLHRLRDGRYIESVLIPANPSLYGEASDRLTLCVSSQVGCAYGCRFCASGLAGFARNLEAGEIVEQVLQAGEAARERISNLVFMGMGEPMANYDALLQALRILNADWGVGLGARHMTVSTSGLAPQIERLAEEPLQIRLAISLHGASDEVRERIMPVNRKYPLDRLFEALRYWAERRKQFLTFEYILIEGVNADLAEAERLARLAQPLRAKVNLIPYNTVEGLPWVRPGEDQQEAFLQVLRRRGITATLRREKGHDIDAACGQLRLREETAEGLVAPPS
ncbi:MAG: 23S rRNA (adenine(2503)-C(2))-methyltransferase RlmN [Verrucomicrobiales bacterium]|nr:23S rRNA (adenine(2503)-C(2))-methyltransferase RlmN [Verrucomicrobiales bacterium]